MKKKKEKITIRLESNDPSILDQGVASLAKYIRGLCTMHGPNLVPTQTDQYIVMRGTERTAYEMKTHRRTIIVTDPLMRRDKNFFNEIGNYTIPNGIDIVLTLGE